MPRIAFVFSGQGPQYPGMGLDLYDGSAEVRDIYAFAEKIIPGITQMSFRSSKEELSRTINTQPCMVLMEYSILRLLLKNGLSCGATAGFSLGEVTAMSCAGLMDLEQMLKYTLARAGAMDRAAQKSNGKMAAILKIDRSLIDELCSDTENVWAVNYNCPGQTVISGLADAVEKTANAAESKGAKVRMLPVSGAFHTPLMKPAYEEVRSYLSGFVPGKQNCPIYWNSTGTAESKGSFREMAAEQIVSPVMWENTILNMEEDGYDTFIEIGPGKVLSGLIRRISPKVNVYSVGDSESLDAVLKLNKGERYA